MMTGQQLWQAALHGDAAAVSTLLSTRGAKSFINYQGTAWFTPLLLAAQNGHETVTKQLIAARCDVHLQTRGGSSPLHLAASKGHEAVTKAAHCCAL
jgi:ankyrin repeat protein